MPLVLIPYDRSVATRRRLDSGLLGTVAGIYLLLGKPLLFPLAYAPKATGYKSPGDYVRADLPSRWYLRWPLSVGAFLVVSAGTVYLPTILAPENSGLLGLV